LTHGHAHAYEYRLSLHRGIYAGANHSLDLTFQERVNSATSHNSNDASPPFSNRSLAVHFDIGINHQARASRGSPLCC
jgi:hypothetical protein